MRRVFPRLRRFSKSGFTVWHDAMLLPHQDFDEAIRGLLDQVCAVLVLWSPNSAESHYVRGEASTALEAEKLVNVIVERCDIPLEFSRVNAADISISEIDARERCFNLILASLHHLRAKNREVLSGTISWKLVSSSLTWNSAVLEITDSQAKYELKYLNKYQQEVIYLNDIEISRGGSSDEFHPFFLFKIKTKAGVSLCKVTPIYNLLSRILTARLDGIRVEIDNRVVADLTR